MLDIRKLRKAAKLTQAQLAQRAHLSRPRLSFAESGYIELRAEEINRIREACAQAAQSHANSVAEMLRTTESAAV